MAIKVNSNLLVWCSVADDEAPGYFSGTFVVGLFVSPSCAILLKHAEAKKAWESTPWYQRSPFQPKLSGMPAQSDLTCVAGASVGEGGGNCLTVENVGAKQGYGPTLYAALLELARARKRDGVLPSRDPTKILPKPREIWRQFAQGSAYSTKIGMRGFSGLHPEPWLNNAFFLKEGAMLLPLQAMRNRAASCIAYWVAQGVYESSITDRIMDMAKLSVTAHRLKDE